jgi:hypothetical protein
MFRSSWAHPQGESCICSKLCCTCIGLSSLVGRKVCWRNPDDKPPRGSKHVGGNKHLLLLLLLLLLLSSSSSSLPVQPSAGYGLLITHNDAPRSVGLLWRCDQLVVETSTLEHNTHNRQTSMPPVGFEPTIAAGERPYNYALDRATIGIDIHQILL